MCDPFEPFDPVTNCTAGTVYRSGLLVWWYHAPGVQEIHVNIDRPSGNNANNAGCVCEDTQTMQKIHVKFI